MSFPSEPIEFTEQYPSIDDQQGIVEGLSELSRFRIRRAFSPTRGVSAANGGGAIVHDVDPFLDRHLVCNAGSGAADSVTCVLPLAANGDACVYSFTRGDPYAATYPANVVISVSTGSGELIDGASSVTLSSRYQSVSMQSDGAAWWIV